MAAAGPRDAVGGGKSLDREGHGRDTRLTLE